MPRSPLLRTRPRSLFFLLVSALLAAPSSVLAAGDLKIGITQFPSTLNPNIESMVAKSYLQAMTARPITAFDQEWQLVCLLCTELPTIENGLAKKEELADGGEGIAVTYTLQPEATWGDGTPVTTRDVLFTYEVGRDPQTGISNAELYQRILSIDVIDDKTFTLHMDRVTFSYNAINDFRLLPAHIERPFFEAGAAEYRNRTAFDSDPTNPGLYHGPYRITEIVKGSYVTLERNPTWWGTAPDFDRITVRTVEKTPALEANLLSGAVDMVAGELGLTLDQALAFEQRHGDDYQVIYKSGLIYEHIDLQLENPILQDVRVRRALLHAIDRQAISDRLFGGKQRRARRAAEAGIQSWFAQGEPASRVSGRDASDSIPGASGTGASAADPRVTRVARTAAAMNRAA